MNKTGSKVNGKVQHCSLPLTDLSEVLYENGLLFKWLFKISDKIHI